MSDLPPEAAGRLASKAFSSGLTVPDFAACLHMGMRPVGLVQGYCVMRWSWYGTMGGAGYIGSGTSMDPRSSRSGTTLSNYRCPHGYGTGAEHRRWGNNFEQPLVTRVWADGFNTAYHRMMEEATAAGAHGVVGVIDRSSNLIDSSIREFHIYGTAVVTDDPPKDGKVWSTYLAGQRLAKLIEAGMFPVSVVASMASVRAWAVCATEMLLHGEWDRWGAVKPGSEIVQVADAEMQARRVARDHIKSVLGHDALHGAAMEVGWREIGAGDFERHCTLRGTRVETVHVPDPLPPPMPTVRLL